MKALELDLYGFNLRPSFFEFPANRAAKLHSLELNGSILTFGILFSANSPFTEAQKLLNDFLKIVGSGNLAAVDGSIQIFEEDAYLQFGDKRTLLTLSVDLHTYMRYSQTMSSYEAGNPNKLAIDLTGVHLKHIFVSNVQPERVSLQFNELSIAFSLSSDEVIDEWVFLQKEFLQGLSHKAILSTILKDKTKRGITHGFVLDFRKLR